MNAPAVVLVCDYSLAYLGGAQVAFIRQAEALLASGHRVVVVAPGATAAFADVAAAGQADALTLIDPPARGVLPVLGLPLLGRVDALAEMLSQLVRSHAAAGLVVHSEFSLAAAAARAARATDVPLLHVVHTFFWRAPRVLAPFAPLVSLFHSRLTGFGPASEKYTASSRINNALRTMTLRMAAQADLVLSPSTHQAERLREAGLPRVEVLSNVALPADPSPAPAEHDPSAALHLLWAGRFAPEKRLPVALSALAIARERLGSGRVHLHVAGGSHRPEPDVTFHGRVSSAQVDALLAASDAVLLTSVGYDNQPMIALEAFARARPVIVSDPVLKEEFGPAVICTATPDAAGLADAICAAAGDRPALRRTGGHALTYARDRTPEAHARHLDAAIGTARAARAR